MSHAALHCTFTGTVTGLWHATATANARLQLAELKTNLAATLPDADD